MYKNVPAIAADTKQPKTVAPIPPATTTASSWSLSNLEGCLALCLCKALSSISSTSLLSSGDKTRGSLFSRSAGSVSIGGNPSPGNRFGGIEMGASFLSMLVALCRQGPNRQIHGDISWSHLACDTASYIESTRLGPKTFKQGAALPIGMIKWRGNVCAAAQLQRIYTSTHQHVMIIRDEVISLLESLHTEGEPATLIVNEQHSTTGCVSWLKQDQTFAGRFEPNSWETIQTAGREAKLLIRGKIIALRALEQCHGQQHYHFEV